MKISRRNLTKLSFSIAPLALPMAWERPIIDVVILPSHAMISNTVCCFLPEGATSTCQNSIAQNVISFENFGGSFIATSASSSVGAQTITTVPPLPALLRNGDALTVTITQGSIDCSGQSSVSNGILTIATNDTTTTEFVFNLPVGQP